MKMKFDVSGSDPEEAVGSLEVTQPPKGVYVMRVIEVNHGYSKDDDGKPDESRPRLEVILKPVADKDGNPLPEDYSRVWDYVSFSKKSEWKQDQFLQAVGLATKKKRKGTLDTDKLPGKLVLCRLVADKDQFGDYRPKVGGMFKFDGELSDGTEESEEEEAEELLDDGDEEETEDSEEDEEFGEDEEDEEEEEGEAVTADDIKAMKAAELKPLVEEWGVKVPKGSKVAKVKQLLIKHLEEQEGEEEDEDDMPF